MARTEENYRGVAVSIIAAANDADRTALVRWSRELLAIRESSQSDWSKTTAALRVSVDGTIIGPTIKIIARALKRVGWDERGSTGRLAGVGVGAGVALFAAQSEALTALGAAVSIPLWVVFGGGDAFVGALIEEATRREGTPNARSQVTRRAKKCA